MYSVHKLVSRPLGITTPVQGWILVLRPGGRAVCREGARRSFGVWEGEESSPRAANELYLPRSKRPGPRNRGAGAGSQRSALPPVGSNTALMDGGRGGKGRRATVSESADQDIDGPTGTEKRSTQTDTPGPRPGSNTRIAHGKTPGTPLDGRRTGHRHTHTVS